MNLSRCLIPLTLAAALASGADPKPPAEIAADATRKLDAYQTKDARVLLDPVAGKAAQEPAVALALGRLLEQEKKYDESAEVLRKALDAAPADPMVPLALGDTLLRAKKADDAAAAFQKAAELSQKRVDADGKDAAARLALGMALKRQKKLDDALSQLEKARELDGGAAATLSEIGMTLALAQRWADAVDALSKAVDKDASMAYAYYYRGLAYEKLGKKDKLVLDFDRFVKLAPEAPEADRARAVLKAAKR